MQNVECRSDDTKLQDNLENAAECAKHCRAQAGCMFFAFGLAGGPREGQCYWEKTSAASCPEGFITVDKNHLYEMLTGETIRLVITRR